jgi:diguanylate cyclase (GGDEF)-like protein/PAS domain S-box-containing protein
MAARAEVNRARHRALLDWLPDTSTFVYDRDHRLVIVGGVFLTSRDLTRPEIMGRTVDEIFAPAEAALMHGYIEAAFDGRAVVAEVRLDDSGPVDLLEAVLLAGIDSTLTDEVVVVVRDISGKRLREQALALSELRWRAVFDRAPIGLAEMGGDGSVIQANQALADLLEVSLDDLAGTYVTDFSHPDDRAAVESRRGALAVGETGEAEVVLRHMVTGRGNDRWVISGASVIGHMEGLPERVLTYMVDNTAEQLTRQRLADANARFAALVEHSSDAILVIDPTDEVLRYASPGLSAIIGTDHAAAIGSSLRDLYHPDDLLKIDAVIAAQVAEPGNVSSFECRLRHADGRWRQVEVTSTNRIDDPAVGGVISNLRDVTDRVEGAQRLAHQAMHDTLTGLPNRDLLLDRLDQALARAARSGRACALLFIDLDRFKQVNDTLGHAAGDQVLTVVAERLQAAVRPGDSAARLGGDEFVVLAENIDDPLTAPTLAERIRTSITEPMAISERTVTVGCSVGIALSNRHAASALLQEADMALLRAKESGRNRWEIYDQAMRTQANHRLAVEDLVRAAVVGHHLMVHYQPIIDLRSGTTIGTEALARIRRPDGTLVNPGDFIPVAEDSGLIIPLGAAVLELACAQQARWQAAGSKRDHVAVNVSARQLSSDDFVAHVAKTLASHQLPPESLCIELTESTLIDIGSSAQSCLLELNALGVTLALDDFGTGWSSLAYLRLYPIDIVKIDRSFVSGLGTDNGDTELVRAVIDLGRALDLTTIAEGVETQTQDRRLRDLGCTQAQGFLYGRPQAAD